MTHQISVNLKSRLREMRGGERRERNTRGGVRERNTRGGEGLFVSKEFVTGRVSQADLPTLYVDNLPGDIHKVWIYNLFARYGKIRDLFIPNKVSKTTGQKFGFVRFSSEKEADQAVEGINGAWVWGFELVVKYASYSKTTKRSPHRFKEQEQSNVQLKRANFQSCLQQNGKIGQGNRPRGGLKQQVNGGHPPNRSYAHRHQESKEIRGKEIWRRKGTEETSKQGDQNGVGMSGKLEIIHSVRADPVGNGWLFRSAVGCMRRLISAPELQEVIMKEYHKEVQVRPMGGRFLLLTFQSEEIRDEAVKGKWLMAYLEEMKPRNGEPSRDERFVWIACYGMPLNAWNVSSFKSIGSKWGHFVEVDDVTLRDSSFLKGRMLVATEQSCKIEGKVQLFVGSSNYMVRVEEEDTFRTVVSDKQHQASVLGLAEKDDDVEGNKTKGIKHKVNLTGKATEEGEESFGKEKEKALQHPFVRENFLNKATVNAPLQQDQHSVIPMAANLLVLEADGSMDARCSNMSHGIESIVEDSEGLLQDRLQAHNEAVSKENPIENKATEENKSTEEENNINTQRQPIFLSGPVLIGSKSKWRASQLEGINLQVELDPRSQRKSLRSQLYEDCMSPGEGVVPDTQERFQNLVQSELNITKEAGRRLGVDFSEVDCRMMKNMIESETNKFFLLQRNNQSSQAGVQ